MSDQYAPLFAVATVNNDVLPETTDSAFSFDYVDISSISDFHISGSLAQFTFREAPSRARRLAKPGDVALSTVRTYLRAIAPITEQHSDSVFSTGFAIIRPNPSVCDSMFLRYATLSTDFIDSVVSHSNGVSYPAINAADVIRLRIPLPPLETQRRIADYLDRETAEIDAAVADLDKYVELLEKRRQVLVSEAVDSLSSVSLIKTVRNLETLGWLELGRGKVISKEDMENSPGDYPVYSSAFTDNGFFGKYGEYLFEDERISWSIDGGGMPFYRHKHRYSLTNVSGWMRVADNSVLDVKYLYYAVLNEWYRNSFDYALKAHPSVIRDLYSISIPDLSSQQQMADYLDRETVEIDNLIAESKKLRVLLLKRRSVLITEVTTGRKQV